MRPKFVLGLLLLALLVMGAAFFLKQPSRNVAPVAQIASAPEVSNIVATLPVPPAPAPPPLPVTTNTLTVEQRRKAIEAETDRLDQWSMRNDSASLSNILSDLTSPEKEVRNAAIEAAKQFGSTNAIPALTAEANATDDPEEKTALQDAADFLSLPSANLTPSGVGAPDTPEQSQNNQQKIAAHILSRQKEMQKARSSQNPQSPSGANPQPAPSN